MWNEGLATGTEPGHYVVVFPAAEGRGEEAVLGRGGLSFGRAGFPAGPFATIKVAWRPPARLGSCPFRLC